MNIGVIGTGKIGARMAKTVAGMEGVCVSAVAARDFEKTKTFADRYDIPRAYQNYAELLQDPDVDLVYIGTPHSMHFRHASDAIRAGKPVLCEKAFTVNAREAETLLALAREKRVFLTEAMWTRYMPWRQKVHELIDSGAIGEVRAVTANLGYKNDHIPRILELASAGGALLDLGVYTINFAVMFLGTGYTKVTSDVLLGETGVDLWNTETLSYPEGRMASLTSTVRVQTDRRGVVCGTKGWIAVDNVIRGENVRLFDENRKEAAVFPAMPEITGFEYQVRACEKALAEGRLECAEMPHADTLAVMRLMDSLRADWGLRYPME